MNLIQVSVSAPQPGAEVLGLQLGLGEAPGLPFRPWDLSGQLAKPLFCSSPTHGRSRGRNWDFQEAGWERTSCYKAMNTNSVSLGWVQSTRRAPAKEVCSASGSWPKLSDGGSKSSGGQQPGG